MSESPPSCFTVSRRYEPKKGNYEIYARLCAYTCVEGVLASVMLMLMPVPMLYKSLNFDDQPQCVFAL